MGQCDIRKGGNSEHSQVNATWGISGRVREITLGIGWRGNARISARNASSEVWSAREHHPAGGFAKLNEATASWEIACGDDASATRFPDSTTDEDELMSDVLSLFSAEPQRAAVGINSGVYLDEYVPEEKETFSPDVLILLPRAAFRALWDLFAQTLDRNDVGYDISIDWEGFAPDDATRNSSTWTTPTWLLFRLGTPILSRSVGVSVRCDVAGEGRAEGG